jgi:hypothetical protein
MIVRPHRASLLLASVIHIFTVMAVFSGIAVLDVILHIIAVILQGTPQILHELGEVIPVETAIVGKRLTVIANKYILWEIVLQSGKVFIIIGESIENDITTFVKGVDTFKVYPHIPFILLSELILSIIGTVEIKASLLHTSRINISGVILYLHNTSIIYSLLYYILVD